MVSKKLSVHTLALFLFSLLVSGTAIAEKPRPNGSGLGAGSQMVLESVDIQTTDRMSNLIAPRWATGTNGAPRKGIPSHKVQPLCFDLLGEPSSKSNCSTPELTLSRPLVSIQPLMSVTCVNQDIRCKSYCGCMRNAANLTMKGASFDTQFGLRPMKAEINQAVYEKKLKAWMMSFGEARSYAAKFKDSDICSPEKLLVGLQNKLKSADCKSKYKDSFNKAAGTLLAIENPSDDALSKLEIKDFDSLLGKLALTRLKITDPNDSNRVAVQCLSVPTQKMLQILPISSPGNSDGRDIAKLELANESLAEVTAMIAELDKADSLEHLNRFKLDNLLADKKSILVFGMFNQLSTVIDANAESNRGESGDGSDSDVDYDSLEQKKERAAIIKSSLVRIKQFLENLKEMNSTLAKVKNVEVLRKNWMEFAINEYGDIDKFSVEQLKKNKDPAATLMSSVQAKCEKLSGDIEAMACEDKDYSDDPLDADVDVALMEKLNSPNSLMFSRPMRLCVEQLMQRGSSSETGISLILGGKSTLEGNFQASGIEAAGMKAGRGFLTSIIQTNAGVGKQSMLRDANASYLCQRMDVLRCSNGKFDDLGAELKLQTRYKDVATGAVIEGTSSTALSENDITQLGEDAALSYCGGDYTDFILKKQCPENGQEPQYICAARQSPGSDEFKAYLRSIGKNPDDVAIVAAARSSVGRDMFSPTRNYNPPVDSDDDFSNFVSSIGGEVTKTGELISSKSALTGDSFGETFKATGQELAAGINATTGVQASRAPASMIPYLPSEQIRQKVAAKDDEIREKEQDVAEKKSQIQNTADQSQKNALQAQMDQLQKDLARLRGERDQLEKERVAAANAEASGDAVASSTSGGAQSKPKSAPQPAQTSSAQGSSSYVAGAGGSTGGSVGSSSGTSSAAAGVTSDFGTGGSSGGARFNTVQQAVSAPASAALLEANQLKLTVNGSDVVAQDVTTLQVPTGATQEVIQRLIADNAEKLKFVDGLAMVELIGQDKKPVYYQVKKQGSSFELVAVKEDIPKQVRNWSASYQNFLQRLRQSTTREPSSQSN